MESSEGSAGPSSTGVAPHTAPHRAGPHAPAAGSPWRQPGSVRRTSTIDSTFPSGDGRASVDARAREIVTRSDGDADLVAEVRLDLSVAPGNVITAIEGDPDEPRLAELVGLAAAGGFRARALAAVPDHAAGTTVLNLLLDDLPGARLVSGYALQRAGLTELPADAMRGLAVANVDLCAGWASDASILVELGRHGQIPSPIGPPAPALEPTDDPQAWHGMAELPLQGMRRRRRLDLTPDGAGRARLDGHFRDSYREPDGRETVVHEYTVTGTVDLDRRGIVAIEAQARVLPWVECPAAVASAGRLADRPVRDLRQEVRTTFVGVSTCTHLNDTLRSLADLDAMIERLRGD